MRLDSFLAGELDELSRSRIGHLIEAGRVKLDGRLPKASVKLRGGEKIEIDLPPPEPALALPEEIPLSIAYEDGDLIVIDKPQGMVVHPAPGAAAGTLVNALLFHCRDLSGIGGVNRPGIVHRLDKDTSGLLVVAKNDFSHQDLSRQISEKSALRQYYALVVGRLKDGEGLIDAPIGRHPTERIKMAIVAGGRPSRTRYRVLEEFRGFSLLELTLESGRTHQIRVHLASLGHPVVGDPVYGNKAPTPVKLPGQALHAFRLAFHHPRSGESLSFTANPPLPFQKLLNLLRSLP
ncbi:MAG TPA: RluA family pseudouridine synthase [Chroococcales cyanobacterium]